MDTQPDTLPPQKLSLGHRLFDKLFPTIRFVYERIRVQSIDFDGDIRFLPARPLVHVALTQPSSVEAVVLACGFFEAAAGQAAAPIPTVAMPGIIAAMIFSFTVSWAQFLYPLAFTTSTSELLLPVGIVTTLIKGDVFNWGQIMTGALLGAAPPLIIYAFLMDYYVAGLTAGATKG